MNPIDRYKFRTEIKLTCGIQKISTVEITKDEFELTNYVDLFLRKTDVLNCSFLDTLKLAQKVVDERKQRLNDIKEGLENDEPNTQQ
jgi:hypothetical protein